MAMFENATVMQGHMAPSSTFNAELIVPKGTHQIIPTNRFSILSTFQRKVEKYITHQQRILG